MIIVRWQKYDLSFVLSIYKAHTMATIKKNVDGLPSLIENRRKQKKKTVI